MIARMAMWVSTIAALVLLASFGMFAVDEARSGSNHQVAKLGSEIEPSGTAAANVNADVNVPNPSPAVERRREKKHGQPREAIDDVNDVLVSPFTGVIDSNSIWAQRGIPTLIAFLLFGVGLRIAAGYLPGGARR